MKFGFVEWQKVHELRTEGVEDDLVRLPAEQQQNGGVGRALHAQRVNFVLRRKFLSFELRAVGQSLKAEEGFFRNNRYFLEWGKKGK